MHCCDKCLCGTKKACCKNKEQALAVSETNTNAGKNAFERHQEAVEAAKLEITVSLLFTLCALIKYKTMDTPKTVFILIQRFD